jgi:cell division protein FtsI (penicillin-binding protein 3)
VTTLGTRGPRRGRASRPAASRTAAGRTGARADRSRTGARAGTSRTAARPTAGRPSASRSRGTRTGASGTAGTTRTATSLRDIRVPAVRDARSSRRLRTVLVVYLLITLAMGWRLVDIQVLSAPEYREMARRQTERDLELPAERGKVYDRTGEPLALSMPTATIVANPRQIRDAGRKVDVRDIARRLARVLPVASDDIEAQLRLDRGFVYLARQMPHHVGEQVAALGVAGVQVLDEPKRTYPAGPLAAQIVGFAGIDNEGLSGLERQYDTLLAGLPGRMVAQQAPQGLEISSAPRIGEPPVAGTDLVLTLDSEVQATTERLLAEGVERYKAKGASAVVIDVKTNEILAMASMPSYAPEEIGSASGYARRNRVVTDAFEPGSVNKAVTAAAALEEGVATPRSKLRIGASHTVAGKAFTDSHVTERATLAEIIRNSSNIGSIKLAERLGPERLHAYLTKFGYGRATALAFPGETDGLLADVDDWSGTSLPTIAIGHGVSASLLQVAQVYATIARGGVAYDPVLVRGTVGSDGTLQRAAPGARTRVVSERTARVLARMLVDVVEDGTGTSAAVPGYEVAGKTGTAQKPRDDAPGYEPGAYVGSFVGFAPADRPEVVVAVAVDESRRGYYGGSTAAPLFSDVMRFTLGHRRVPPNDPGALDDSDGPDV